MLLNYYLEASSTICLHRQALETGIKSFIVCVRKLNWNLADFPRSHSWYLTKLWFRHRVSGSKSSVLLPSALELALAEQVYLFKQIQQVLQLAPGCWNSQPRHCMLLGDLTSETASSLSISVLSSPGCCHPSAHLRFIVLTAESKDKVAIERGQTAPPKKTGIFLALTKVSAASQ